jgi:hypothetical protein
VDRALGALLLVGVLGTAVFVVVPVLTGAKWRFWRGWPGTRVPDSTEVPPSVIWTARIAAGAVVLGLGLAYWFCA